jgi:hypothetical protein
MAAVPSPALPPSEETTGIPQQPKPFDEPQKSSDGTKSEPMKEIKAKP